MVLNSKHRLMVPVWDGCCVCIDMSLRRVDPKISLVMGVGVDWLKLGWC